MGLWEGALSESGPVNNSFICSAFVKVKKQKKLFRCKEQKQESGQTGPFIFRQLVSSNNEKIMFSRAQSDIQRGSFVKNK